MNDEIVVYSKADFLTGTAPYEALYALRGDPFRHERALEEMAASAKACKVNNFKKLYGSYCKTLANQKQELVAANVTDFEGQELELDTGGWRAGEFGIYTDGPFGSVIEACNHPLLITMRLINIDTGGEKLRIAFKKGKQWRGVTVEKGVLASANKVLELANQGVAVTSESAKYLVRYLYDLEALNYDRIPEKRSVGRLGWIPNAGFSPFVDDLEFDGDVCFAGYFEAVKPRGKLDKWLRLVRTVRESSIFARVILAASFASVLVEPLGGLPFFVHLWGGTEAGKTVALMLAASVWASPEVGRYIHTFNSTAVGREKSAAFVNSLPLILDELQIVKDRREFDKDIYLLSEGAGRTRGNKAGGVDRTGTWKNCILTSGEMPITGSSSGGGAVNRIVEVECNERIFQDPRTVADTVRKHYGHAGRCFVEKLTADGGMAHAEELYKGFSSALEATDTTEKQAMAAALILTADALATEWIFEDGRALTAEEIGEFLHTRASVSANERGYSYICEAVAQNSAKFLHSDGVMPLTDIWGKIDDEAAYIVRRAFDALCTEGGYNAQALLSWLKQQGHISTTDGRMTRTVRIGGIPARCVVLRLPEMDDGEQICDDLLP